MLIKYARGNFNFLYRMLQWFLDNTQEYDVKDAVELLMDKIRVNHSWEFSNETFIVLDFNDSDISTLLYVYENSLFVTYEARAIMNICHDKFSEFKESDSKSSLNELCGDGSGI